MTLFTLANGPLMAWRLVGIAAAKPEQLSRPVDQVVLTVLPARQDAPHGDLDVVAVPGYFGHAESLVEGLGAVVNGEHL